MMRPLLLFLCALAPLAGCSQEKETPPEVVRPVLSMVVAPTASHTMGFVGTVEPEFSANLAFRLLGRVVTRDVEVGDLVKKGETLAALDPTALDLGVQAAKAEFSNAEAQFANASASEERQRQLLAALQTRGHAAMEAIRVASPEDKQWREGKLPEALRKARAHPEWSTLNGRKRVDKSERQEQVDALAQQLLEP